MDTWRRQPVARDEEEKYVFQININLNVKHNLYVDPSIPAKDFSILNSVCNT
jgi:hypothetical protein